MAVGATAEPEAKAASKVVANAELTARLKKYTESDKKATAFFAEACAYAVDKKLSKPVFEASLKAARPDWSEATFKSELSRLWRFTKPEHRQLLNEMVAGKKTVTAARAEITKKQLNPAAGKKTNEVKLNERIKDAAEFAAKNAKELLIDTSDVDAEDEDSVSEANEAAKDAFTEQCGSMFEEALREFPIFGAAAPEGTTTEGEEEHKEGEGEDES